MNSEELQLVPASDGVTSVIHIAYRFRKPSAGKPVFVWFCGFKSEMDSIKATALSEWCAERGAGCLRFDYSGHGRSEGSFEDGTISAWLGQAAKVCETALSGEDVVFVGSSMGGWISLLLARLSLGAGRTLPKAIALIAPAWDMTAMMWEKASEQARAEVMTKGVYYRQSAYGDAPYAITRKLIEDGTVHLFGDGPVELTVPVRILHGMQDPDVSWHRSLTLLDILSCADMRLTLIKDGEHRLSRPQDLQALFAILSEFA